MWQGYRERLCNEQAQPQHCGFQNQIETGVNVDRRELHVNKITFFRRALRCGIAKCQTAANLMHLANLGGMLVEVKIGREKLFLHPNFVRLRTSDDHPILPYGVTASRKN